MPVTEPAKDNRESRSPRCLWIVATTVVATASFLAGYCVKNHRHKGRVYEEGRRQFLEFLGIATDLGIVTVDRQKLDELVITASEAEWEDRDAAERETSVKTENRLEEP